MTLTLTATLAAAPDTAFLAKLAANDAREDKPQRIEHTQEDLDSKGKPEKTIRTVLKREGDEFVTIEASVDGKDVLERVRASEAKSKEGKHDEKSVSVSVPPSPFQADQQALYNFTATPVGTDGAQLRIDFAPKGKKTEKVAEGFAVVDVTDAALVTLSFHPAKNESFVDEMQFDVTYLRGPNGSRPATMVVKGSGGFLFIRKRIRSTDTFGY